MKAQENRSGDGIGTAKALLGLIAEHSARDFEAALAVLGGNAELAHLLRLLRELKEKEEAAREPITVETFVDVVQRELAGLPITPAVLSRMVAEITGAPLRTPPGPTFKPTLKDAAGQAVRAVRERQQTPKDEVEALARLLVRTAVEAGAEHEARILALLRKLAIQALTENTVIFPSVHSLAELRLWWAEASLPYNPQESRANVVERLFKDAERLPLDDLVHVTVEWLKEGLRGPADAAIATLRRGGVKKAKANGE